MELSKEHLIAFDEILKKYQTEYGEQEYKMYYDVDLPKIMMEAVNAYANSVERLLKGESNSYLAKANEIKEKDVERSVVYHRQHNLIERLLTELKTIKP